VSEYDPRQSVSVPLSEVRTVLSRAKSALAIIKDSEEAAVQLLYGSAHPGPDLEAIKAALETAVRALEPWERHGSRAGRGGRSVR